MKLSRKILLATGGLVFVGILASLGVLRYVALQFIRNTEAGSNYRVITVDNFENLDFAGGWTVRIMQGNEYKVEVADDVNSRLKPDLKTIDGTLYFRIPVTDSLTNSESLHVKITTPSLKGIKAMRGTEIRLEEFQGDSIRLELQDGNAFTGYNNYFKYIQFKTSGDVSLQLTDDGTSMNQ